MQIGCLGDIPFYVSESVIQTVSKFTWSGSMQITEHKRHMSDALTEPTGRGADTVSFTLTLSRFLGIDPMAMLEKLWTYQREYVTLPLVLGGHGYGKYRWLLKSIKVSVQHFDPSGNIASCDVSISLIEYVRRE